MYRTPIWLLLAAFVVSACGGAAPRYPTDVATALASEPMRHIETERLHLYYPEQRREEALRVAERLEGCAAVLRQRTHIKNSYSRDKMVIVLPELPFNNAFVSGPAAGQHPYSVLPTFNTFDFTTELGLPPDPAYIGCHEIVHYVHLLQVSGIWHFINRVFGNALSTQNGFDSWFIEGLATYYESRLQPRTGRMAWPVWRGMLLAGVAEERISGGDLSSLMRASHWGNNYHLGSFFIEYLAERYGEDRLWRLIAVQGDSFFVPLGVSLRFNSVYGKPLGALIDDFDAHLRRTYPPRMPPPEQRRLRRLGREARYALAADGTEAEITRDFDRPARLLVRDAAGALLAEHHLTGVLPPRMLSSGSPSLVSGMSFTADSKRLYFAVVDAGSVYDTVRLVEYDRQRDRLRVVHDDLGGVGGAISGDGGSFYFSRADGDRMHLAELDLASGSIRDRVTADARSYYLKPRPSPDGSALVVSLFTEAEGFTVRVYDLATGDEITTVPTAGARAFDASFVDGERLVLLAEHQGRFQVFVHRLGSGVIQRVSDAPYLAFAPRARGDSVRFLSRAGWGWELAEVALPAPAAASEDAASAGADTEAGTGALAATGRSTPASTSLSSPAGVRAAPAVRAPVRVLDDEPYSQLDHLFVPQSRGPLGNLQVGSGDQLISLGLTLAGADRLSFHNWWLAAQVDLHGDERRFGGGAAYVNTQLAPVILGASAIQLPTWTLTGSQGFVAGRQRDLDLYAYRTWRNAFTAYLGATYTEDDQTRLLGDAPESERHLGGATLSLSYGAGEATPYGGLRRALSAAADASFYPASLSSFGEHFTDLRGQLDITLPLPLSRRHALDLGLRGRQVLGAEDYNLLQVGGFGDYALLFQRGEVDDADAPEDLFGYLLPPNALFGETLRGFESYPLFVDRIAIADAVYRVPLIIDRGTASTLWLLPSLFVRQLDIQLFASAALERMRDFDQRLHAAAGASLGLDFAFANIPLSVRYQLAQRLTDNEALVHDIGLGIGF